MKTGWLVGFLPLQWLAIFLVGGCLFLPTARAAVLTFEASLDSSQEVPPNGSPAYGDVTLTLNTVSGFVTNVNGSFTGLASGADWVYIGDAGYGTSGLNILLLYHFGSNGKTSGLFGGSGTITAAQITDMINSNTYISITDSVHPYPGEIRGQLDIVPEPSTVTLECLGLAWLLALRRRRRPRSS